MTDINELFKVGLRSPVKLKDLDVYALPITNWIHPANSAYIYTKVCDNRMRWTIREYCSNDSKSIEYNSRGGIIIANVTADNLVSCLNEYIAEAAHLINHAVNSTEYGARLCDHPEVSTSEFNDWVCHKFGDLFISDYVSIMLRESMALIYTKSELSNRLENLLSSTNLNDQTDKNYVMMIIKGSYVSFGETHCGIYVHQKSIAKVMAIDPCVRFITTEVRFGMEVEIDSNPLPTKYFIEESIHSYIPTELTVNESFWREVSAERYYGYAGNKVKTEISDEDFVPIKYKDAYLDTLSGKVSFDKAKLINLINKTMTGPFKTYTRFEVYPENYEFSDDDAVAACLDYACRVVNFVVDDFIRGYGYKLSSSDDAENRRCYQITRIYDGREGLIN